MAFDSAFSEVGIGSSVGSDLSITNAEAVVSTMSNHVHDNEHDSMSPLRL